MTAKPPGLAREPRETAPQKGLEEGTREWLLTRLRQILEIAMERVTNPKTAAQDRIKWSRIVIAAGQALNAILHDVELAALKQQINELKQLMDVRLTEDEEPESDDNEDQRD